MSLLVFCKFSEPNGQGFYNERNPIFVLPLCVTDVTVPINHEHEDYCT